MADRRIYAGYYRRYDGKMIYVVTMAKDTDTNEDAVIWTPTVFSEKRTYYTMSKQSFCEFVSVGGVRKAKFKRQTQMRMPPSVAEGFEEDGFVRPQRRTSAHIEEYDSWHRPNAGTYYEYAKKLCEGYRFSKVKYALCVKEKRYIGISKNDFRELKSDLLFLKNCLKTVLPQQTRCRLNPWRPLFHVVRPFVPILRDGWPYTFDTVKCGVGPRVTNVGQASQTAPFPRL